MSCSVAGRTSTSHAPCVVRWCSFWHVNGVAVFREETDANGGGGAMMVSTIVRASPKSVYKVP